LAFWFENKPSGNPGVSHNAHSRLRSVFEILKAFEEWYVHIEERTHLNEFEKEARPDVFQVVQLFLQNLA
jgi:hypothetical protein